MVEYSAEQLTELFQEIIAEYNLNEIFEVIENLTDGDLFLVGGFLYRTLSSKIQNINLVGNPDLDFVTDKLKEINVPQTWKITKNKYDGVKFITPIFSIDIDEFKDHVSLNFLKLPFNIESYLSAVPLTIQSLSYDIKNNKIIGDIGIKSINSKKIGVNNKIMFNLKKEKLTSKILSKAKDLNFVPILP